MWHTFILKSKNGVNSHPWLAALLFIWIFLAGMALSLNVRSPFPYFYFFADGATYYGMTYSLAYDFDLVYTKADLERVCTEWSGGPTGIFLKKDAAGVITFGKSFLFPLFAMIPVRLFGSNGFLILNAICFALMVSLGAVFLKRSGNHYSGLSFSLLYFLFSTAWLFVFWIHPEVLIMTLVMTALFLWFTDDEVSPAWKSSGRRVLMGICLGFATFGKVTNAIYLAPICLDFLMKRVESSTDQGLSNSKNDTGIIRRFAAVLLLIGVAGAVTFSCFGINKLATGDWNYQWGERKGFAREFPFENETATFDNLGGSATRENLEIKFNPGLLLLNIFYFFVGRFGGLLPYFFPALVAVILMIGGPRDRKGRFLLITLACQQLFFLVFLTDNFLGGMGTIGNRYFLNAYPAFIFLIRKKVPPAALLLMTIIGSLYLGPMIINPYAHGVQPAEHTFAVPFKLVPVELSQIDFLPIHINHHLSRRVVEAELPYRITFLDYQTHLLEGKGIWVKPGREAEMLLETQVRATKVKVTVENRLYPNTVRIAFDGDHRTLSLAPGEIRTLTFTAAPRFEHNGWLIHRYCVQAQRGFIPRFHEEGSTDGRYLGCYVSLTFQAE
jgi:hypothetical protein